MGDLTRISEILVVVNQQTFLLLRGTQSAPVCSVGVQEAPVAGQGTVCVQGNEVWGERRERVVNKGLCIGMLIRRG